MKTYSLTVENHMVAGGLCDSRVQDPRTAPRTCAACLSATDHTQYMADVGNYICHHCRESYREAAAYIRPLRWYDE
ncbi:MAG: hypothetical protein JSS76_15210 [Bacteroidetes bacterium]|nr:hypothetical protein [Bacteroidota bacterium]